MTIYLGSARIDENGKASGGKKGDQKQTASPDYKGEVSMQKFYTHKLGWNIIRPKSVECAKKIANNMQVLCNNACYGYDQGNRYDVVKNGISSKTKGGCDCSSSVRACVKEATGKDPGDFTTANEKTKLLATGLFEDKGSYVSQEKTPLYNGDILVTKSKGHTVVVVSGSSRSTESSNTKVMSKSFKVASSALNALNGVYSATYEKGTYTVKKTDKSTGSVLLVNSKHSTGGWYHF